MSWLRRLSPRTVEAPRPGEGVRFRESVSAHLASRDGVGAGFLTKIKKLMFFRSVFILYAVCLSKKFGYVRYIAIFGQPERRRAALDGRTASTRA